MRFPLLDTLLRWTKAYKVDGFRFDLMNLHDTLKALTVDTDSIDGNKIYLYGEGWDFSSAKDKGLRYAKQFNMAGTEIGTFNDKICNASH